MEIQQHDGVVVMEWQYSGRASPSSCGGGEVLGRGGAAPSLVCCSPPLTPLYIGGEGQGAGPLGETLEGGGGQREREKGWLAPQARWRRPHP